jgi:hypothetical protein
LSAATKAVRDAITEATGGAETGPVRYMMAEGNAARVLLDASAGADLLVVGSRGHGGFVEALLGSTGQRAHRPLGPSDQPLSPTAARRAGTQDLRGDFPSPALSGSGVGGRCRVVALSLSAFPPAWLPGQTRSGPARSGSPARPAGTSTLTSSSLVTARDQRPGCGGPWSRPEAPMRHRCRRRAWPALPTRLRHRAHAAGTAMAEAVQSPVRPDRRPLVPLRPAGSPYPQPPTAGRLARC